MVESGNGRMGAPDFGRLAAAQGMKEAEIPEVVRETVVAAFEFAGRVLRFRGRPRDQVAAAFLEGEMREFRRAGYVKKNGVARKCGVCGKEFRCRATAKLERCFRCYKKGQKNSCIGAGIYCKV